MLNHEPLRLADGEYRFACLVWDNEPLPSGQLVALAAEGLGWKKSTTYTVLKKLCERGAGPCRPATPPVRPHRRGRSTAKRQERYCAWLFLLIAGGVEQCTDLGGLGVADGL